MNEVFKSRKIWGGYISVPSFLYDYAKRTHKKIRIEFEGQYMIVDTKTPYEITAPTQTAQRTDKYTKKGTPYQLYDFFWVPVEEIRPEEYTATGLTKLHEAMAKFFKPKPTQLKI